MRFRNTFVIIGSLIVLLVMILTDPNNNLITKIPYGAGTLSLLIILVGSIWYVAFLHFSRKALIDYIDLEEFFIKAKETSTGAGLALIAVGLIMISISLVILAAVK